MLPGFEGRPSDVVSLNEPHYQGLETCVVSPKADPDLRRFGTRDRLCQDADGTYIFIYKYIYKKTVEKTVYERL